MSIQNKLHKNWLEIIMFSTSSVKPARQFSPGMQIFGVQWLWKWSIWKGMNNNNNLKFA